VWPVVDPPLVSIIIPTRDKPELIKQCVDGMLRRTSYPRKEIVLVDTFSLDPTVHEFYDELRRDGLATIVPFERDFNYSAACNAGARAARGELLLFLNNDIEVRDPGWLEEMVRFAQLPGVGVVGTKLLYPDGLIQHAGVVIGMHMCGLIFNRLPKRTSSGRQPIWSSWGCSKTPTSIPGSARTMPRRRSARRPNRRRGKRCRSRCTTSSCPAVRRRRSTSSTIWRSARKLGDTPG